MLVMVLNDGETFTSLSGCRILRVPDGVEDDDIDTWVKDNFGNGKDLNIVDDEGLFLIQRLP
jgi:hypothetical protein